VQRRTQKCEKVQAKREKKSRRMTETGLGEARACKNKETKEKKKAMEDRVPHERPQSRKSCQRSAHVSLTLGETQASEEAIEKLGWPDS
jgi:hypothetical protein